MRVATFNFDKQWNMGPSCRDRSENPAPHTNPCIYIIHNSIENTTYVGYAQNAYDRWATRYEVFHTFGIPEAHGRQMLCACCNPTGPNLGLKDLQSYEHLLLRCVMNGMLGTTKNTNTLMCNESFDAGRVDKVIVLLPGGVTWGRLTSWEKDFNGAI